MDSQRFDDLTKALGTATSRRRLLRGLVATAIGGLAAGNRSGEARDAGRSGSRRRSGDAPDAICLPGQVDRQDSCVCRATGRPPIDNASCRAGQTACQGCCVDECRRGAVRDPDRCTCVCPPQLEACGRQCVEPDSYLSDPANCGGCDVACPAPSNAEVFCDAGQCGFVCLSGFRRCGDECIAAGACCTAAECPTPTGLCQAAPICVDHVCGFSPAPFGTECRSASGDCDLAEVCDGSATDCPPDRFAPATTVCRPAAGPCDASEFCTGSSAICPTDLLRPAGTPCRQATHVCEGDALCDGAVATCPSNPVLPNGTPCAAMGLVCESGTCSGITCSGLGVFCETDTECCQDEPTICGFNAAGDSGRRCTHPAGGTCRTPVDCVLPNGCFPDGICRL